MGSDQPFSPGLVFGHDPNKEHPIGVGIQRNIHLDFRSPVKPGFSEELPVSRNHLNPNIQCFGKLYQQAAKPGTWIGRKEEFFYFQDLVSRSDQGRHDIPAAIAVGDGNFKEPTGGKRCCSGPCTGIPLILEGAVDAFAQDGSCPRLGIRRADKNGQVERSRATEYLDIIEINKIIALPPGCQEPNPYILSTKGVEFNRNLFHYR